VNQVLATAAIPLDQRRSEGRRAMPSWRSSRMLMTPVQGESNCELTRGPNCRPPDPSTQPVGCLSSGGGTGHRGQPNEFHGPDPPPRVVPPPGWKRGTSFDVHGRTTTNSNRHVAWRKPAKALAATPSGGQLGTVREFRFTLESSIEVRAPFRPRRAGQLRDVGLSLLQLRPTMRVTVAETRSSHGAL
jgi:hypothetical protein